MDGNDEAATAAVRRWPQRRIALSLTLLLLTAPSAYAVRFEFEFIQQSGERLRGAQVCFFPAAPSAETPYEKYLWSNDVRCSDADKIIAVPPGRWNYFGHHHSGFVTNARLSLVVTGAPERTDAGYKKVRTDVVPAASARIAGELNAIGPNEHLLLYFPTSASTMSHVRPVPPGQRQLEVPADEEFLPLVVSRGVITRAGSLQRASIAREHPVHIPAAGRGLLTSYVTFRLPPDDFDGPLNPPDVALTMRDTERHQPVVPTERIAPGDLVIFKNVPPGEGTLTVTGRYFASLMREVNVRDAAPAVLNPLLLDSAGVLNVDLPSAPLIEQLLGTREEPSCGAPILTKVIVRVRRCEGDDCAIVREQALTSPDQLVVDGLLPGNYRAQLLAAGRAIAEGPSVRVDAYKEVRSSLTTPYATVAGVVTRGRSPLRARVEFRGVVATTDESGSYTALVPAFEKLETVIVTPCDSKCAYTVRLSSTSTLLDIDLPSTDLRVKVVNAASGQPVGDAGTRISSTTATGEVELSAPGPRTDEEGIAAFCGSPVGKTYAVCADAAGYVPGCVPIPEPSRLPELVLVKLEKRDTQTRGRIRSRTAPEMATMFFINRARGAVTEMVRLAADGTFTLARPHAADEVAVLVARNLPLTFVVRDHSHPDEVTFDVPAGTPRYIEVRLRPDVATSLAVSAAIGGVAMPVRAISLHQALRGQQAVVSVRQPVLLYVLESAPVEILRGFDQMPADIGGSDEFLDVRYGPAHERTPVPPGSSVVTIR